MISISLFGDLQVVGPSGKPVPIKGSKMQGLLSYLALNMDMPPARDRLVTLFWRDRFAEQARQSLRQAISKLKKLLDDAEDDVLWARNDRIGLRSENVSIDVERFIELVSRKSGEDALQAAALYKAPLLESLYAQQSDFEDWLTAERQRVVALACPAFERAVEHLVKQGDVDQALDLARRLIDIDPFRESSQGLVMRVLAQSGRRAAAIQQFQSFSETLRRELGVDPGPDLQRLVQEIRSVGFGVRDDRAMAASLPTEKAAQPRAQKDRAEASRSSIAVLPFTTLGDDQEQAFLAEGLTLDITTTLSKFRWLEVKASPDLEATRLTAQEMLRLSKELALDYAVSGTIREFRQALRLTVHLVELKSGRYLSVTRYDRQSDSLADIQDELSDTIAASVEAELERARGQAARHVDEHALTAWDSYHRGLSAQYEFGRATNEEAQRLFRRAIALDPGFAAAYARLSYAMVLSAIYFEAPDVARILDEALELAQISCRLDSGDAVGRFALGRVYLARGEYDRSVTELQAAIDLNPGMAQAHCGLGDSLAYSGNLEPALRCFHEALRVSPQDPYRWAFLSYGATALLFKREFAQAADWARQASQVPNAHYWANAVLASALGHLGDDAGARRAVDELKRRKPDITCDFVRDRLFYLRDPAQVEIYLEGLRKSGLC